MQITLVDALAPHAGTRRAAAALEAAGHTVAVHALAAEVFAPCQGCFDCWVTTPGECKIHDAANTLMSDLAAADIAIWIARPRFGAWDPLAKSALDRTIGLLLPFFDTVDDETHHIARYGHYPRWVVLAEGEEDAAFRQLVGRNALNLHEAPAVVRFLAPDAPPDAWEAAALEATQTVMTTDATPLMITPPAPRPSAGPAGRHVTLLVGSAKPKGTSTSESLGRALVDHLIGHDWTHEIVHLQYVTKHRGLSPKLRAAAQRADLLVLASPVYVDCLPALVLEALTQLADADDLGPTALLPVVQSGFPELTHCRLAIDLLGRVADTAGWRWAGHLAMGGGGGIDGRPLHRLDERVRHQREGLLAAAEALNAGEGLPAEATEAFGTPMMSAGIYRAAGQVGWLVHSARRGGIWKLWRRPFL